MKKHGQDLKDYDGDFIEEYSFSGSADILVDTVYSIDGMNNILKNHIFGHELE